MKLMVFVDGTNFLSQIARVLDVKYDGQKPPEKAIEAASAIINKVINKVRSSYGELTLLSPVRKYWFGSYKGDGDYYYKLREFLRLRRYEPVLFKAHDNKEKGVDIALTREMLLNAFNQNYDVGLVVAGDEDYLELINDVKRFGIRVIGSFFEESGLSKELKISYDQFIAMNEETKVQDNLGRYKAEILEETSKKRKTSKN